METPNDSAAGKPKGWLLNILNEHSTTIIAIMMSLIAIEAEHISALRNDADEREQAVQEERVNLEDEVSDIDNQKAELNIKYNEQSEQSELDSAINEITAREAIVQEREDSVQKVEDKMEEVLAVADNKENKSNWAKELSELAILLSAIGVSSKKRMLQYVAAALTLVSLLIVLYTFML